MAIEQRRESIIQQVETREVEWINPREREQILLEAIGQAPEEIIKKHGYQPPEPGIRPLERVHADSAEPHIQKPLTM